MEVASQFGAQGAPMGYRIDSELTVGAEPLLKLAAASASHHNRSTATDAEASLTGKEPAWAN
jgi:hypothetical protein